MTEKRKHIANRSTSRPPLTDDEGNVRELTAEDLQEFRPTSEFPELAGFLERLRGQRGPQKAPTKEWIGLRLDHDIVAYFRQTGPGWQSRINDVLARHVQDNKR
jgi:uncharacterized protein (DUF4415 family)